MMLVWRFVAMMMASFVWGASISHVFGTGITATLLGLGGGLFIGLALAPWVFDW